MKKKLGFWVFFFSFLANLSLLSAAQAETPADNPLENDIKVRAKKRLYPGGRDEESLKIQTPLLIPTRKKEVDYQSELQVDQKSQGSDSAPESTPATEEPQD